LADFVKTTSVSIHLVKVKSSRFCLGIPQSSAPPVFVLDLLLFAVSFLSLLRGLSHRRLRAVLPSFLPCLAS
jgi:hypothetical protein